MSVRYSPIWLGSERWKKSSRMRQGARPPQSSRKILAGGWNYCYFQPWQLCLRTSPRSKFLLTDGWLQVTVTCAVGTGKVPSGPQALCEDTHWYSILTVSGNSLVSAFPCASVCDAAPGVEQAGWSLQHGTWVCPRLCLSVKLPVVWVCSGMDLCFTLLCWLSYLFRFWVAVCFLTSLQHNDSLWRYSAINSPLPVPDSMWYFLPQAGKHRYGAEIKPAKSCTTLPQKYLPRSIWDHTLEPSYFLPQV